jgi:SRSO17 transposase
VVDRTATARLRRLLTGLEPLEGGFGRPSQRGALRRYVTGLFNDSRRKSMEAMWARLSDPGTYEAFQHFIRNAPRHAEALWKRLREVASERTGADPRRVFCRGLPATRRAATAAGPPGTCQ